MIRSPPSGRRGRFTSLQLAVLLTVTGATGRILLANLANVETVLAVTMLAAVLLRGWYAVVVPLAAMAISDAVLYATGIGGALGLPAILGVTAFTWSGFLIVAAIASRIDRSRILFAVRSVAVLTSVSIPATILYDLWTDIGEWYFIAAPHGLTALEVLEAQVPFTLVHIASSLIFVPLFGTIFLWLHLHGTTIEEPTTAPDEERTPSE